MGQFQQEENPSEEGFKEAILSNLDMLSFEPLAFEILYRKGTEH